MITAGPAYCAAASPVVTKMPAPTTRRDAERGQADGPMRRGVEARAVALGLSDDGVEVRAATGAILHRPRTCSTALRRPRSDGVDAARSTMLAAREPEATPAAATDFQEAEREHRLAKLDALRERGIEPYPVRFDRDATAAELHDGYVAPGARRRDRQDRCASPAA